MVGVAVSAVAGSVENRMPFSQSGTTVDLPGLTGNPGLGRRLTESESLAGAYGLAPDGGRMWGCHCEPVGGGRSGSDKTGSRAW